MSDAFDNRFYREAATKDERVAFLEQAPVAKLANIIADYCSDSVGVSSALFAVGMNPLFRTTQPEELFDLICPIIRRHIAAENERLKEEHSQ